MDAMIPSIQQHGISREVHRSVAAYLANGDGSRMVTMANAIDHLRAEFPGLRASDCRLTDVIAGRVIILGLNIELDGGGSRTARVDRWSKSGS